jgi:hypothetical protein
MALRPLRSPGHGCSRRERKGWPRQQTTSLERLLLSAQNRTGRPKIGRDWQNRSKRTPDVKAGAYAYAAGCKADGSAVSVKNKRTMLQTMKTILGVSLLILLTQSAYAAHCRATVPTGNVCMTLTAWDATTLAFTLARIDSFIPWMRWKSGCGTAVT